MAVILHRRSARTELAQQLLEQEMAAARTFQELLVTGSVPGVEAIYLPAREVGGDFYQVAQRHGARMVLVGDVSGKGLEAAMVASEAIGAFRSSTSISPREILQTLNRALCGQGRHGFVTCLCARIEESGRLTLATAGHPAPYSAGEEFDVPGGLPLGINADAEYEEFTREASHQITFFSDGVVEAANAKGELFGFDRMRQMSGKPAAAIAEAARAWGQNDDITVVTVQRVAV
jgi:serine phosphatase RsbU (regulator of sigma subunit)